MSEKNEEASPALKAWAAPFTLGVAAFLVFCFPDRSLSVLLGLAAVASSPLLSDVPMPTSLNGLKAALSTFIGDLLTPAMSQSLPKALKVTLSDDEVVDTMISMMSKLLMNKRFSQMVQDVLVAAMEDEKLIRDMVANTLRIAKTCTEDEELRQTSMEVIQNAVVTALQDDIFMENFRDAICTGLGDEKIYKAAANGVLGSITKHPVQTMKRLIRGDKHKGGAADDLNAIVEEAIDNEKSEELSRPNSE